MERYQKLVYKIALSYGWGREHALDITQNVFLKAYQNLGSLRAEDRFKSWVARITCHESVNWIRKHKKHLHHEEVEGCVIPAGGPNQEEELLGKESREILHRSLHCLNPRHRLVVTLRYFEAMSIHDIASVLGRSEGLVKNMLFRSLGGLKDNLDRNQTGIGHEPLPRIRITN